MKTTTLFIVLLALTAVQAAEEAKKGQKRGIFDKGFGHGSGLTTGEGHSFGPHNFGSLFSLDDASHHGPIDLGSHMQKHITITKKVGVPVPKSYPVHVEKKVPVLYPVEVKVPVDKPYPVPVAKPYSVLVEKPVPYTVEKKIPILVKVFVKVPYPVKVVVSVPKPYSVPIIKKVPVHVPEPVIVKKPVSVFIKGHDSHSDISFGTHGVFNAGFSGHNEHLGRFESEFGEHAGSLHGLEPGFNGHDFH